MKGETTALWSSIYKSDQYRRFKAKVKKRDDYKCRHCHCEKQKKNRIHVHHDKPKAKFLHLTLEPDNAFLLCASCHIEEHKRLAIEHPEWKKLPNATAPELTELLSTLTFNYYNKRRTKKRPAKRRPRRNP
jgi:5-methylcytosine-specific restriction endonuclease McrA